MDPIADFLNSLKMASRTNKESFVFPASGIVMDIASVLVKSGYLSSVRKIKKGREIQMTLPVSSKTPGITSTKRVSRLSKRIYRRARDIRPVRNGSGTAVFSTPKGVLSDVDARAGKVGGEVLFEIW